VKETYTVKELFGNDLTRKEIMFLNKWLKKLMELEKRPMLLRRTVFGDSYPSNQWPKWTAHYACGLLVGLRNLDNEHGYGVDENDVGDRYVLMPQRKWGAPNYSGEWEDSEELGKVEQYFGEKLYDN